MKRHLSKAKTFHLAKSAFQRAVEATPDVSTGYCKGLHALKGCDRVKIVVQDSEQLDGSVDIDTSTVKQYPEDNRWDYAISYDGKVCFVEVHPACTSDIDKMICKLKWLKGWLANKASQIGALPRTDHPFVWIPSNNVNIPSTAPQRKKISANGIKLVSPLRLK